tara:strand:+ start:2398 stop:5310 length:2913 start_codon:yes stop_codon:yes gene_type:complete
MAGRVQIVALGTISDSLSIDPSFSFFTKRFSKYTNYATENFKISFAEGVHTGDFLEVPIPQKYGDILQDITLSFVADPNSIPGLIEGAASNLFPIDIFGISVIEYVELFVGDHKIDTITSDDIFIDRELNIPESYRSSVDVLHGKHFQGSSDREFLQEFYDGQYNVQGVDPFSTNEYRIQIPFYFHRRPAHGFPLCSIYDQELLLRIKLRPAIDVIFATQDKFNDTLWDPEANNRVTRQLELSNFKVNLNLVHLNTAERCMLQSRPLEILFEQHQRNTFFIEPESKTGNFKLDFKNCVKELFFIAKKTGKWTDEYISILNQLHQLDNYTPTQVRTLTTLKQISIWGGVIGVALDALVGEADVDKRKADIDVIRLSIYWGNGAQITLLDALLTPSGDDQAYVTTLKQYIDTIPTQINVIQVNATTDLLSIPGTTGTQRSDIIDRLLAIPSIWGSGQIGILNLLRTPGLPQEEILILGLRVYLGVTSYYLSGIDTLKPGETEQISTINKLKEFLDATKLYFDGLKTTVKLSLDDFPNETVAQRQTRVDDLLIIPVWKNEIYTLVNSLTSLPPLAAGRDITIETLESYVQAVSRGIPTLKFILNVLKGGVGGVLDDLGTKSAVERDPIIIGILSLHEWDATQFGLLNALRIPSGNDSANIAALKASATGLDIMEGYTQFQQSQIIDGLLPQNIWGDKYFTLLDLRDIEPGNATHGTTIDTLTTYLDTLSTTTTSVLSDLTSLETAADANAHNTIVTNLLQQTNLDTIWGGYFVYLLDTLKDASLDGTTNATETANIILIKKYLDSAFLTASGNNNIQFLITQLTIQYPQTIFNKWVRAKKNVPLMYSKQKFLTLECDGAKILDKTTGSNMFLSASLPNLYHKRSPNFRNINMYSFALHPNELRPSGHLNFSTVKDGYVYVELEYDGGHGTFDFDDNYIDLFKISPIYFPKQFIIIAKSYNMMIIRDGRAQVQF